MGIADLLCVLMALVWGANLALAKDALVEIPPLAFNGVRLPAASLLLAIVVSWRGMQLMPPRGERLRILLLGILGNTAYQLFFMGGLALTRAGNTGLLLASSAIWIGLLSRLLGHEQLSGRVWAAIALSVTGVMVLFWESWTLTLVADGLAGDVLIVCSALCWSFFTVLARPLLERRSPLLVTTQTLMAGSAVFLLISLPDIVGVDWRQVSTRSLLELAYSAVFAIALAYTIWFVAVERIGNTRTAVYNNLVPVFAILTAALVLGESITAVQLGGGALIMTAVVLARIRGRPRPLEARGR